jgi:gamma-glutamyl-gamma-aminobutyrate hydrolase PuuD
MFKKLGYSPYAYHGTMYPFDKMFESWERLDYTPAKHCDAIVLWGGTDVDPKYYNEQPHPMNGFQADSPRDQAEWAWMMEAQNWEIPIIGICRGAQFLCVKAGGKLIQHMVQPHHMTHPIRTKDGEFMAANDHHQCMDTDGVLNKLIGWHPVDMTPEIVYFPNIKGLAIQGHPEWEKPDAPVLAYYLSLVEKLIKGEL